jgi:hypothetical protein
MKKTGFILLSTSIAVIGAFELFKGHPFYMKTDAIETKAIASTGYLRVTEGSGSITQSSYPNIIPPNRIKSQVNRGVYDSRNLTLTLDVQNRRIDINLKEPLVDNKPIPFVAKYVGKFDGAYGFSFLFNKIKPNLIISCPIKIEGNLEKKRNQINIRFTATSDFNWWGEEIPEKGLPREGNGSVSGKLTLKIGSGQKTDLLPAPESPVCYY